jgi:hypothetical protein
MQNHRSFDSDGQETTHWPARPAAMSTSNTDAASAAPETRPVTREALTVAPSEPPTGSVAALFDEHVAAIEQQGYTRREAAFLARVAIAGGYFTRQQFADALGLERGKTDARFVRRLVQRGDASMQVFCDATQVYHLTAAGLWSVVVGVPRRQRRPRPPLAIRARLLALDLVLALPDVSFALGDPARVRICDEAGIPRAAVPIRQYRCDRAVALRTRLLPDALLVGQSDQSATRGIVLGCIEDAGRTQPTFETSVRRHLPMLAWAAAWTIAYGCESATRAVAAERTFQRVLADSPVMDLTDRRAEAVEYCELRDQYERQRWTDLGAAGIQRYLALKSRFGGLGDVVFEAWRQGGETAVASRLASGSRLQNGRLLPLVLPARDRVFEARRRRR